MAPLTASRGYSSLGLGCLSCVWAGPSVPGKNQHLCLGVPLSPGTWEGGCHIKDPCSLHRPLCLGSSLLPEECGPELPGAACPVLLSPTLVLNFTSPEWASYHLLARGIWTSRPPGVRGCGGGSGGGMPSRFGPFTLVCNLQVLTETFSALSGQSVE